MSADSKTNANMSPDQRDDTNTTLPYAAFLSYSTEPDYAIARDVEAYLEAFHLRAGIKPLRLRKLEVCRDGSDFKLPQKNESAFERAPIYGILDGYLSESDYLAVLCSQNARKSDYVAHEIRYFLKNDRADRILLLATEGADPSLTPEEVFPKEIIDARLHLNPWYDLRGKRARKVPTLKRVRDYEDELARLAAHLHGDSAGRIYPAWQRQHERTQRLIRAAIAVAALATSSAVGWWGWTRTDTYQYRRLVAEAPIHEVRRIGDFAQIVAKSGDFEKALRIARAPTDPDSQFEALLSVAGVLQESGDTERAGSAYLEALRLPRSYWNPVDPDYAKCLAGVIVTAGFVPQVDQVLKEGDGSLLGSTTTLVLKAGKSEDALRVARSIVGNFQSSRTNALAEVAAATQEPHKARSILEEALRDAEGELDGFLGREKIVRGFLLIGDFDRAWTIADRKEYGADGNFSALASWAAERGDLNKARSALKKAGQYAQKFLIERLTDNGLTQQAVELSRDEAYDINSRIESLLYIARKSRASGNADRVAMILDEALRVIGDYDVSGATLNKVALALADFGNTKDARRVLDDVAIRALKDKDWDVIVETAQSQATLGLTRQALELANHIVENRKKQEAMGQVVFALARAGAAESSLDLIHTLEQPGETGGACEQLMTIFLAKAMIAQAIKASECIENVGRRSAVLLNALRELARENKANQALEIFAVIPEIPGLVGGDDRAAAAIDLVPSLARNGQLDIALNLTSKQEPGTRVIALSRIVAALDSTAKVQRSQLASSTLDVKVVGESSKTDGIWGAVASNLTRAGELREALQAARRVIDDGKRSMELAAIVIAYGEAGSIIDARRVLGEVPAPSTRMRAIVDILKARQKQRVTKERTDGAS